MLKLKGSIVVGSCKSCSHRSILLSAMSVGKAKIRNLLESEDVLSTLHILKNLGIRIEKSGNFYIVWGQGTNGFMEPDKALECNNSGTTARLCIGAVASNPITCTFTGDKSLSSRDMSRITNFLVQMGAEVKLTKQQYLPLMISGSDKLIPRKFIMEKASAQVKSGLILAALNTHGTTRIIENKPTRDHTERLMKFLNIKFKINKLKNGGNEIVLNGPYEFKSKNITVPGDPSSAAFFIVGALIIPNSKIVLKNVMLNSTRTGYIDILKKMGGKIKIQKTKTLSGEDVGNITVEYSKLKGININASLFPKLVDEYPILSIAATQANGLTVMKGLGELRHKESDRQQSIFYNLKRIGFKVNLKNDQLTIYGGKVKLKNNITIRTWSDHRISMSFSILNILYENKLKIDDTKCISISYPKFIEHVNQLATKN